MRKRERAASRRIKHMYYPKVTQFGNETLTFMRKPSPGSYHASGFYWNGDDLWIEMASHYDTVDKGYSRLVKIMLIKGTSNRPGVGCKISYKTRRVLACVDGAKTIGKGIADLKLRFDEAKEGLLAEHEEVIRVQAQKMAELMVIG